MRSIWEGKAAATAEQPRNYLPLFLRYESNLKGTPACPEEEKKKPIPHIFATFHSLPDGTTNKVVLQGKYACFSLVYSTQTSLASARKKDAKLDSKATHATQNTKGTVLACLVLAAWPPISRPIPTSGYLPFNENW